MSWSSGSPYMSINRVIWPQPKYSAGFPKEARRIFIKQRQITHRNRSKSESLIRTSKIPTSELSKLFIPTLTFSKEKKYPEAVICR